MNLTEATVKALQKEDKATDRELVNNMNLYRKSLQYLDKLYNIMEDTDIFGNYGFSNTYYEAEEEFLDKLLDERTRIEKLLGRVETDLIDRSKRKN